MESMALQDIERAIDNGTREEKAFAIQAARGRKDLTNELFVKIVNTVFSNPQWSLEGFYAPVLLSYDWVRKFIKGSSRSRRYCAIAYCLGRVDVPEDILTYCLTEYDSKISNLGFNIVEMTYVPYSKILSWSESEENLNFQIASLRYHRNARFLDYEVAQNACGAFGCLPEEMRRELVKKICVPDYILRRWLDSDCIDLKHLAIEVCDELPYVEKSLLDFGIRHQEPDVNQAMYRICARSALPRKTVEFWLVRGGKEYTTAALAAYSKIGGAPQRLVENILIDPTSDPTMRYYAQMIYDNHMYEDNRLMY